MEIKKLRIDNNSTVFRNDNQCRNILPVPYDNIPLCDDI